MELNKLKQELQLEQYQDLRDHRSARLPSTSLRTSPIANGAFVAEGHLEGQDPISGKVKTITWRSSNKH